MKKVIILMQERGKYYTNLRESFYRAFKKNEFATSVVEINANFSDTLTGKIKNKFLTSPINKKIVQKI